MADLSKIKVGGTTYNIKDVDAREDITELSSQIDDLETAEGQTRGMISDTWTQKTWYEGEYCIDNNKLWKCLVTNSNRPSESANWEEDSITNSFGIESGSNSNGNWIKLVDGTLIQYGRHTFPSISSGGMATETIYFPVLFINTSPNVFATISGYVLAIGNNASLLCVAQNTTLCNLRITCASGTALVSTTVMWMAIGRWK